MGRLANRVRSLVALEACGGSQHWARRLEELGHEVQSLPAKIVRAFVRGNKNAHDARAICVAVAWFIVSETLWLFAILIGGPLYASWRIPKDQDIRALSLPRGSIRAMLALVIVGSFVILWCSRRSCARSRSKFSTR